MVKEGIRIIKVVSTKKARCYGYWYTDLIGTEFEVLMYDICSAEYTVKYNDKWHRIPDEDVEIVSDVPRQQ